MRKAAGLKSAGLLCILFYPGIGAGAAQTWYVSGSVAVSGDGTSWQKAFKTIQAGIDKAQHGDTLIVGVGNYLENVRFNGKNIVLRSTNPTYPGTVTGTVIDGGWNGAPAVRFSGTEDETCVLSGFTITNGSAVEAGGGLWNCDGEIRSNTISENYADYYGGGLAYCNGTIEGNVIRQNSASRGGGLYGCNGTVRRNRIAGNSGDGGGLCACNGEITGNLITGNRGGHGAGLYDCDGIVSGNRIEGNEACYGGGLSGCDGAIYNNLILANSAGSWAGLYDCRGALRNNTIVGNTADVGEAVARCTYEITNCIIWGNTSATSAQIDRLSMPTYSCIQNWTGGGEGNIKANPQFADSDYRLLPSSPCIDAGVNEEWMSEATDLNGNPRISQGFASLIVDMGAYEYPTLAFSIIKIAKDSDANVEITWISRPGDNYFVWSCLDVLKGPWIVIGTIPSQGTTTVWTDVSVQSACRFYRIEMRP